MTNIDEVSLSLGRIEQKVDDLTKSFNKLPCEREIRRVDKIEAYQNKQVGVIVTVGAVFGFIGWLATPLINWLLEKIK